MDSPTLEGISSPPIESVIVPRESCYTRLRRWLLWSLTAIWIGGVVLRVVDWQIGLALTGLLLPIVAYERRLSGIPHMGRFLLWEDRFQWGTDADLEPEVLLREVVNVAPGRLDTAGNPTSIRIVLQSGEKLVIQPYGFGSARLAEILRLLEAQIAKTPSP